MFTVGKFDIAYIFIYQYLKNVNWACTLIIPVVVVLESIILLLCKTPIIVAKVDWLKTKFDAFVKSWQTWKQAGLVENVKCAVNDP